MFGQIEKNKIKRNMFSNLNLHENYNTGSKVQNYPWICFTHLEVLPT